jgi:PrtD family type I secretion system ABC transporter
MHNPGTLQNAAPGSASGTSAVARALAGCRRAFWAAGIFSFCESLLMLTIPLYSFQMYDRVMTSRSGDTLWMLSVLALGALAVLALLDGVRAQVLTRIGMWMEARLAGNLFAAGIANTMRGEERGVQGLRDLGVLRGFVNGPGLVALFDAPTVPVFLMAAFLIHPLLGVIALLGALLLIALAWVNLKATRPLLAASGAAQIQALNRAAAHTRNADAIEAMGMMPVLKRRFETTNAQVMGLQAVAADRLGLMGSVTKLVRLALQIITMAAGCYLVIEQQMTGGMMIAASIITSRGLAPIETALGSWSGTIAAREAWRSINEVIARSAFREEAMALPKPTGKLTLEKATFVAPFDPNRRPILKGVSFELNPGEALGIIGPTAAGKSTLARLLVGSLPPYSGSVRLDGAEVYRWDRADFGRHVGYLPQDVQLFAGTVAENIARMGEVKAEAVVAAAKLAGVHELILHLPQGYETPIGEGGALLSGGQRQRVALARAFYGSPKLVVLDEPNANLDTAGEEALMTALAEAKERGITLVVVTHRPNLLQRVDKVAMLKDGLIELIGFRNEVLAKVTRPTVTAAAFPGQSAVVTAMPLSATRTGGAD